MGEGANECRHAVGARRTNGVMDSGFSIAWVGLGWPCRGPGKHCCCTARLVPVNEPASQSNQRANFRSGRWKGTGGIGARGLWPDSNPKGVICPRHVCIVVSGGLLAELQGKISVARWVKICRRMDCREAPPHSARRLLLNPSDATLEVCMGYQLRSWLAVHQLNQNGLQSIFAGELHRRNAVSIVGDQNDSVG